MSEPLKAGCKCPQCGKPIDVVHNAKIIYRGYDHITRRQCVKQAVMQFCSPQCAGNYQMGCEG
jgi:endogenous inhibitor of DNA gyrase (YacG/DUF329 family)